MPKSGDVVIYIDAEGAEHNALVGAVNPGDDSRLSVLYVDSGRDHEFNSGARENTIHWRVDLEHVDAKVNPVNCWKEVSVMPLPGGGTFIVQPDCFHTARQLDQDKPKD